MVGLREAWLHRNGLAVRWELSAVAGEISVLQAVARYKSCLLTGPEEQYPAQNLLYL